ncbi:vWA domain-containing protein [Anaeromyxobacter oryzisoli]|uniref:vWA domain-containing protein n=1 Tax=Anaeromyxobacter oryzisoli TaxID=2925408 RepID=UPI001F56B117|nr:VWA domain-containing protein [Anaeromyxobacter sp. SG63]
MIPAPLHLAHPWALVLLAAIPLAIAAILLERRRAPRLRHPRAATLARAGRGVVARVWWLPHALVVAALGLAAVALARPQARERRPEASQVEGIDIVIAFDLSTSMKAADFKPDNRLHVAKEVLKGFIGRRTSDRIGLVVFAGDAYTQAPLTLDYGILRALVDRLDFGVIEDGTAIGNALGTAVNRLRESDAKSKAIVLITDGENNSGQLAPLEAAEMARTLGIRVFPILVGKGGVVPYPIGADLFGQPVYQYREFPVNPGLLQRIAQVTGGVYANATDRETLEHGLQQVLDRMEKTRIFEATGTSRPVELFPRLLAPAFWLALAGLVLGATRWRAFP